MSPTYLRFGCSAVKSRFIRSGALVSEGLGTVVRTRRRSRIPAMPRSAMTRATRFVVDPVLGCGVVELGGDAGRTVGLVGLLHQPDPFGQLLVRCGPLRPPRRRRVPGVERGPVDLDDLAQPLHLEGVSVVGDELEAAHQFVSPAKYLAA